MWRKLLAGSAAGDAVDSASRVVSAKTCFGTHVTLDATQTLPE
jgi:hypothetical protein